MWETVERYLNVLTANKGQPDQTELGLHWSKVTYFVCMIIRCFMKVITKSLDGQTGGCTGNLKQKSKKWLIEASNMVNPCCLTDAF